MHSKRKTNLLTAVHWCELVSEYFRVLQDAIARALVWIPQTLPQTHQSNRHAQAVAPFREALE